MGIDLTGFTEYKNRMDKIGESIRGKTKVKVGVFAKEGSALSKYAGLHEEGGTITPKTARWLTIPLNKQAKGKSPRQFPNLKFIPSKKGSPFLAMVSNKKVTPYYVLKKKIVIPKRAFIGDTVNNPAKVAKVFDVNKSIFERVLRGESNINQYLNGIGESFAAEFKNTINDGMSPPNSPLTIALKGHSATLKGKSPFKLMQSITFKLE